MNDDSFAEFLRSVKEAAAIYRGEQTPSRSFHFQPLDIKKIRDGYNLTQREFASLLGISVSTLRNWEQGRRTPEGPAMALLKVAQKHPQAVLDSLLNR
ncbi:MAG: NadS family protein [Anaerolineaceae bacterium]|jgi:putative transcriptional regulator|nr:NadS family protein [Anaerolineaceae bacterium]